MDHNHLYGDKMPDEAKNIIPVIFMASFFEIKGYLPSADSIENLNVDEIQQIGILFNEIFDLYNGKEEHTFGFFEDGFKLM